MTGMPQVDMNFEREIHISAVSLAQIISKQQ